MRRALAEIDVTLLPDPRQVADEARRTEQPIVLREGEDDVAFIVPIPSRRRGDPERAKARLEATLSTFGAWRDVVDTEELKREIRAARGSDRALTET